MSADAFYVCYGIRCEVDAADAAVIDMLELREHPWQVAAKHHRLHCIWGTTTDDRRKFVLIGRMIGSFGWEGKSTVQLSNGEVAALLAETTQRLRAAGIEEPPAWHFQFEPDR